MADDCTKTTDTIKEKVEKSRTEAAPTGDQTSVPEPPDVVTEATQALLDEVLTWNDGKSTAVCQSDVVNQLRFSHGFTEGQVKRVEELLYGTDKFSKSSARPDLVIIDDSPLTADGARTSHGRMTRDSAVHGGLAKEKVAHVGIRPPVEKDLYIDPKLTATQNLAVATFRAVGKSVKEILENLKVEYGTEPGAKLPPVSISMATSPYHLSNETNGDFLAIAPSELGLSPNIKPERMTQQDRDKIELSLRNLAKSGDKRAESILESVDALRTYARAGGSIQIAWGNNDKIGLVEILAGPDKNIDIVGSDSSMVAGRRADYNRDTAKFIERFEQGTVIKAPNTSGVEADLRAFPNAQIMKAGTDSIAGKPLDELKVSENSFQTKAEEYLKFEAMVEVNAILKALNVPDGSGRFNELAQKAILEMNFESLDKIAIIAGHQIRLDGDPLSRATAIAEFLADPYKREGIRITAERFIQDGLRQQPGSDTEEKIDAWRKSLNTYFDGVLLNSSQIGSIYNHKDPLGQEVKPPKGEGHIDKDNGKILYRLNITSSGPEPKTYVIVPLKVDGKQAGNTAVEFYVGTSFAAPLRAAKEALVQAKK